MGRMQPLPVNGAFWGREIFNPCRGGFSRVAPKSLWQPHTSHIWLSAAWQFLQDRTIHLGQEDRSASHAQSHTVERPPANIPSGLVPVHGEALLQWNER